MKKTTKINGVPVKYVSTIDIEFSVRELLSNPEAYDPEAWEFMKKDCLEELELSLLSSSSSKQSFFINSHASGS